MLAFFIGHLLSLVDQGSVLVVGKVRSKLTSPPEEIDELREQGQLKSFTCVEYDDNEKEEREENNE